MPRGLRQLGPRFLVIAAVVVLGLAGYASTGRAQDQQQHENDEWLALLERVPDGSSSTSSVYLADYSAAKQVTRTRTRAQSSSPEKRFDELAQEAGIATGEFLMRDRIAVSRRVPPGLRRDLGINAWKVERELQAGLPSNGLITVLQGQFDLGATLDAARGDDVWADELVLKRTRNGTEYASWGTEGSRGAKATASRPNGRGGRLAVRGEFLWWSDKTQPLLEALRVESGREPSLADAPEFRELVNVMSELGVYSMHLSDQVERPHDYAELPPGATLLDPYEAYGIGVSHQGGQHLMVLTFAYANPSLAEDNARRLEKMVTSEVRFSDHTPWRDLLEVKTIEVRGDTIVARLAVDRPGLWQAILHSREQLISAA